MKFSKLSKVIKLQKSISNKIIKTFIKSTSCFIFFRKCSLIIDFKFQIRLLNFRWMYLVTVSHTIHKYQMRIALFSSIYFDFFLSKQSSKPWAISSISYQFPWSFIFLLFSLFFFTFSKAWRQCWIFSPHRTASGVRYPSFPIWQRWTFGTVFACVSSMHHCWNLSVSIMWEGSGRCIMLSIDPVKIL